MTPKDRCPRELPVHPHGWTMQQTIHLNYGGGKGAATYSISAPDGRLMPLQYQYDTRQPKPAGPRGGKAVMPADTGFVIIDRTQPDGFYGPVVRTWGQLLPIWARWMAGAPDDSERAAKLPTASLTSWPFPVSAHADPEQAQPNAGASTPSWCHECMLPAKGPCDFKDCPVGVRAGDGGQQ